MNDNPVGAAATWYKKNVPGGPAGSAALAAAVMYAASRAGWSPFVETLRSVARPFGVKTLGGGPEGEAKWDEAMDNLKERSDMRSKVPLLFAGLTGLGSLAATYRPNEAHGGQLEWNAPFDYYVPKITPLNPYTYVRGMPKYGSLGMLGYDSSTDWGSSVNLSTARDLFTNDPNLRDYPYSRHMGEAIVTNAAMNENTTRPTLGGIFDSAVDKIGKKLTFGGLAQTGLHTMVANGAARLFTNALGSVCDLGPTARKTLVDAGTWAGAITSILE